MDQSILSSRAVIGYYYARLEQNPGLAWVNGVANLFGSDQATETYPFLGQSPIFREWIGGRSAKGLRGNALTIANKHYEATLEIAVKDARRDKTGQIIARVNEFVDRSMTHWATLLSTLNLAGDTTVCYDGAYYYDTAHSEGDSGSQSNKIDVDISALPTQTHGVVTLPSVEEMQVAILQGIAQIMGFKDDRGEPMNEDAMGFLVQVPTSLFLVAQQAVSMAVTANSGVANLNANMLARLQVEVAMNPRLNSWTDKFTIHRTDSPVKGFIRQEESGVDLKVKAEGSEYEFDNDAWQFGIDTWRGAGFGYWQRSCRVTLT